MAIGEALLVPAPAARQLARQDRFGDLAGQALGSSVWDEARFQDLRSFFLSDLLVLVNITDYRTRYTETTSRVTRVIC